MPPPAEPVLPASAAAGARAATLATARRARVELATVGVASFALNTALASWMVFRLNVFMLDAMARANNALAILFGSEPKLANIGFVWAPLPTLLQVPVLLAPAMRYRGIAGGLVTALAGAGAAMLIGLSLRRAGVPGPVRWLILAAFVLNPMVLFYSSNGMSEMLLMLFVLLEIHLFLHWQDGARWTHLAGAGAAAAAAFLARYDALFVAAAVAAAIGAIALSWKPDVPQFAESAVLMFAAPVAYLVGLWVIINWVIMGDPLFFAHSSTSNAGRIGFYLASVPWLAAVKGDPLATARLTLVESWGIFPAFPILSAALAGLAVYRRTWNWIGLLVVAWSLILFTSLNVFLGQSYIYLRYFIAAIPMAFLLAAGVVQLLGRGRALASLLMAVLLAVSGLGSLRAMQQSTEWGGVHGQFIDAVLTGRPVETWAPEIELAEYINARTTGRILVDDFEGNRVILFSGQSARFITPSDSRFKSYLREPVENVSYVLAWAPVLDGTLDQINRAYPGLYEHGASWATLEKQIASWKLYRVVGSPGPATAP